MGGGGTGGSAGRVWIGPEYTVGVISGMIAGAMLGYGYGADIWWLRVFTIPLAFLASPRWIARKWRARIDRRANRETNEGDQE